MKKFRLSIVIIVISVFSGGCSSLNWSMKPVEDVGELRKERKSASVLEFERRRDWAEFHAAMTAWKQGDTMRCRESIERLLVRNPDHAEALALMARLEEQDKMSIEPAGSVQLASFESSSEPALSDGSAKLAERARANGSMALAEAARLVGEGEKALSGGDCEAAMAFFEQAMSTIPDDPQIPTLAAVSALQLNRPDVATRLAREAATRFPGHASLLRALGVACYRSGDYESSQVVLQQALSLDNTSALTYFLQGCTLSKLGKSEAASAHLRQAATLDPCYAPRIRNCPIQTETALDERDYTTQAFHTNCGLTDAYRPGGMVRRTIGDQ